MLYINWVIYIVIIYEYINLFEGMKGYIYIYIYIIKKKTIICHVTNRVTCHIL
jgi:hypothetical protein